MGLAADNRIRRPAEFRHVLKSGQKTGRRSADHLLLISATPSGLPGSRIGLSVGTRVGRSVVRNRVKRRLREIFRELVVAGPVSHGEADGGWDIVATARPEAAQASYEDLRASAARLMSRVKSRR